eukprot:scaffold6.g2785.t1
MQTQLAGRGTTLARLGSAFSSCAVTRLPQRRLACRPAALQLGAGSTISAALPSSSPPSSSSAAVAAPPPPCLAARAAARRGPARQRRRLAPPAARPRDPDAVEGGDEEEESNKEPPSLLWRVAAALCYLVPWIDSMSLGREMYRRFRNLLVLYFIPGPLSKIYFSSQFAPLIIFFAMFLSVVKNTKLHHFVRFNCMQARAVWCGVVRVCREGERVWAIMLDIAVMLFHILRAYLPAELKWSMIGRAFDMFSWTTCMGTVVFCVFWTLRGHYADIPFVSESVYIQARLRGRFARDLRPPWWPGCRW